MSRRRGRSFPTRPAVASAPQKSAPSARIIRLAGAVIAAAGLLAYANTFSAPFLFDDETAIVDNPTIRHLWPPWEALSPPLHGGGAAGRPLVNLSFAINHALGGLRVEGYHAVNLLIHLAAGLTLFGLVRRTLALRPCGSELARDSEPREPARSHNGQPARSADSGLLQENALPVAFFSALLWTVHPLLTESVTSVVQRNESLMGLCYLLTLYCLVRAAESPAPLRWLAGSFTACVLGMGCKEVMVSAPVIAVLYDVAFLSGSWREMGRRRGKFFALLALSWVPLALLVAANHQRFGTVGFGLGITWWEYALTQCRAIVHYLALSFWPNPLVFDYGDAFVKKFAEVWPQAVVLAGLLAATATAWCRKIPAAFLGLCFFAILAPSSSILPLATQTIAEHRMYLPLAAVTVLAVGGAWSVAGRWSPVLLAGLALALVCSTVRRNEDYGSALSLWRDTAAKAPGNARARSNLGNALVDAGQDDAARVELEEAVRLKPDFATAHFNLANVLGRLDRPAEAIAHHLESLRLEPHSAQTHNNLGNIYARQARWAEAGAEYVAAVRLKPNFPEAENNLGNVLVSLGRPDAAVPHFEMALHLAPGVPLVHFNLAAALAAAGRPAEAIVHYQAVVQLAPGHADAHCRLGTLLAATGRRAEGIRELEEALRLKPDHEEARRQLALLGQPTMP